MGRNKILVDRNNFRKYMNKNSNKEPERMAINIEIMK
jgi:hypothetical protein